MEQVIMFTSFMVQVRCLLTAATTATFRITDEKLYDSIVTLSIEDNSKLTKLLNEGFKRPIYWNEYKVTPNKTVEIAAVNDVTYIRELLDSSCQVAADLSKQKALDTDSRAIQQIIFTAKIKATVANTRIVIFCVLEKSKETILEFQREKQKFYRSIKDIFIG